MRSLGAFVSAASLSAAVSAHAMVTPHDDDRALTDMMWRGFDVRIYALRT
jgi:hypothetical protein